MSRAILPCSDSAQLAIVGSRNPSPIGCETSQALAHSLAKFGMTITSGLALGVDAAAHRGALNAGGTTIVVTGTGLDRVYPACHRRFAHEIVGCGALVSEFPPGTPPRPEHFPRRNRIISGLSLGTLVTKAALHSGSLIEAGRFLPSPGRYINPSHAAATAYSVTGPSLPKKFMI
jgi:DNA processing protein